jgi:hypothetical protein
MSAEIRKISTEHSARTVRTGGRSPSAQNAENFPRAATANPPGSRPPRLRRPRAPAHEFHRVGLNCATWPSLLSERMSIRGLKLVHDLGQPCANVCTAAARPARERTEIVSASDSRRLPDPTRAVRVSLGLARRMAMDAPGRSAPDGGQRLRQRLAAARAVGRARGADALRRVPGFALGITSRRRTGAVYRIY